MKTKADIVAKLRDFADDLEKADIDAVEFGHHHLEITGRLRFGDRGGPWVTLFVLPEDMPHDGLIKEAEEADDGYGQG
jgi:hypothetical protein